MAKISIIMPVWNAETCLNAAISSVTGQTFSDWELIIINDGSTDSSGEICDRFAGTDNRIRVLHQANSGVSRARNAGIDMSTGEFIAFLDSDDRYEPKFLETLYGLITSNSCDCAACANVLEYPDKSCGYENPPVPAGIYSGDDVRRDIVLPLLQDRLNPTPLNGYVWRYLFRSDIIKNSEIRFSGAYLEDELFLIEYFSLAGSLVATNQALYVYFQNPGSVTRRYLKNYVDTFFASLELKRSLVEKYSIPVSPDWENNTCWAGLLIAVSNEFAPGNRAPFSEKLSQLKKLCAETHFKNAVDNYTPVATSRNKAIVVSLLRRRLHTLLAIMYTIKNRNRG